MVLIKGWLSYQMCRSFLHSVWHEHVSIHLPGTFDHHDHGQLVQQETRQGMTQTVLSKAFPWRVISNLALENEDINMALAACQLYIDVFLHVSVKFSEFRYRMSICASEM